MSDRRKACALCGAKPGRRGLYWAMPLDGDLIAFAWMGEWHPRTGDVPMCGTCIVVGAGKGAA